MRLSNGTVLKSLKAEVWRCGRYSGCDFKLQSDSLDLSLRVIGTNPDLLFENQSTFNYLFIHNKIFPWIATIFYGFVSIAHGLLLFQSIPLRSFCWKLVLLWPSSFSRQRLQCYSPVSCVQSLFCFPFFFALENKKEDVSAENRREGARTMRPIPVDDSVKPFFPTQEAMTFLTAWRTATPDDSVRFMRIGELADENEDFAGLSDVDGEPVTLRYFSAFAREPGEFLFCAVLPVIHFFGPRLWIVVGISRIRLKSPKGAKIIPRYWLRL